MAAIDSDSPYFAGRSSIKVAGMAAIDSESSIWEQIERCESYMVCSMYEEAVSLASSVIKHALNLAAEYESLYDMMESAGMVLVQSMRELGRTAEILNQLQTLFISSSAIPVDVFLIGVCFQISEGSLDTKEFIEEFLGSWKYADDEGHYTLVANEAKKTSLKDVLEVDKYLEVAEVYILTLLGKVLNDLDHAISWVENASLPDDKRQGLLRKLHSQYSIKATVPQESSSSWQQDDRETPFRDETSKEVSKTDHMKSVSDEESDRRRSIIELYRKAEKGFWWSRTIINLRFGGVRLAVSNGKVLLGFLIMLACFFLRRKRITFQRVITKQALSMKNAIMDFWKLAFSYQVNPLAAVQPLGAAATSRAAGH